MIKLELPNSFKNIYPVTIYEDNIGVFYKCIKDGCKIVYIEKIGETYELVTDKKKLKYLNKKYDIPSSWKGVVF